MTREMDKSQAIQYMIDHSKMRTELRKFSLSNYGKIKSGIGVTIFNSFQECKRLKREIKEGEKIFYKNK